MKKFLIMGNQNAITYNSIFYHLINKEVRIGINYLFWYQVPDDYPLYGKAVKEEGGKKYIKVNGSCWITNLDSNYKPPFLELKRVYSKVYYQYFDKTSVLNVDKVSDIPKDYKGVMGVPLTFIYKYNPEQFDIVGIANHGVGNEYDYFKPFINGKEIFKRLLIVNKEIQEHNE